MDRVWAPWRMEYIKSDKEKGECILCALQKKPLSSDSLVLYRGEHAYIVMNRYPYNSGHLMIVSNRHTDQMTSFSSEANHEMLGLMGKSIEILKDATKAEGFNCGLNLGKIAGAGVVGHFHLHVVPRWSGDTNFFPVIGQTKSMPEYLEETYNQLSERFSKI